MNLWESIRIAVRGLNANKMRSGLTMLGIIIGVGAVISLLSVGEGAQAAITEGIRDVGSNLIFVMPGAVSRGGVMMAAGSAASLTLGDAEAIGDPVNCPDVAAVAPIFIDNGQVIYGGENINTRIQGTTPDFVLVRNFRPWEGEFFTAQDLAAKSRVAVLGFQTAQDLFGDESPVGHTIKINRVRFQVIGVMEEKGGMAMGPGGASQDEMILVPITTAYARLFGGQAASGVGRKVSMITASAVSEDQIDVATDQISWLLRDRHKIQYQDDDFTVFSQKDLLGLLNQVTDILTIFLGAIAAISLLVGGIGIMNIMLVSITERTREIGLRKAVGAKRQDILAQFLIEAMILSLIGGLMGILFGAGVAGIVNRTGVLTTVVSAQSVILAVGFSAAVGLFFGIYPARRAAMLDPIDALRYE